MRAMVLAEIGEPLVLKELANPPVLPDEVLVRVEACGVCRTDLHVIDGDLPFVKPPVIPGHEVVGVVERGGCGVEEASACHGLVAPAAFAPIARRRARTCVIIRNSLAIPGQAGSPAMWSLVPLTVFACATIRMQ